MQIAIIRNLSNPEVTPIEARYCASFLCRLRGLTFRRYLERDCGLMLVQGRDSRIDASIHMLFVWIELAIVWIDSSYNVVDTKLARRWRPVYMPVRPARYVLELAAERLGDFQIGDHVDIDKK